MKYPPPGEFRPWGRYEIIHQNDTNWTKILYIYPSQSLSLQYHNYRAERWTPLDDGVKAEIGGQTLALVVGMCYTVMKQQPHRLHNPTNRVVRVLEVAVGAPNERDIVRLSDKYGRVE